MPKGVNWSIFTLP